MQYALVNGLKSEPRKGEIGFCIGCGGKMIAKCGNLKLHHWAHSVVTKCDSWWETETEWHREWKNNFSAEFREVSFYDEFSQEYHRADIHTASGLTIEFQNSPLSVEELFSRERFYNQLIWVVNGLKFKGFTKDVHIPNPTSSLLVDYEFVNSQHLQFVRKNEVLKDRGNDVSARSNLAERLSLHHPELKYLEVSSTHFSFSWRHAHQTWYVAERPVFIDFGGHFLYWMRKRKQISGDYLYLQMISKKKFIEKYS